VLRSFASIQHAEHPGVSLQMIRDSLELDDRGVELSVVDWGGEGALAVLSHANGFCASLYAPVAERLRDAGYRVMAFDSRGHGDSAVLVPPEPYEWEEFARDFGAVARALVRRVGAPRVELAVGHSFGGTALLAAAAREPELFGRLALLDPVLIPSLAERSALKPSGPHPMALAARRRMPTFPSREAVRASWARRGIFSDWDARILDLYLLDGFRDLDDGTVGLKCPPQVEAAIFEAGPRFDLFQELPSLVTPALWLHAGQGAFPAELVARAAALSDAIECVTLDQGHLMLMTAPAEIAERLIWFADSASVAERGATAS
jgi:pimeloyl-ACP methyl ester carboxylesterase